MNGRQHKGNFSKNVILSGQHFAARISRNHRFIAKNFRYRFDVKSSTKYKYINLKYFWFTYLITYEDTQGTYNKNQFLSVSEG